MPGLGKLLCYHLPASSDKRLIAKVARFRERLAAEGIDVASSSAEGDSTEERSKKLVQEKYGGSCAFALRMEQECAMDLECNFPSPPPSPPSPPATSSTVAFDLVVRLSAASLSW